MKSSFSKRAFERGFTLIELMIVIVILGVLIGTLLPRLTGAQQRSRDLARLTGARDIGAALQNYFDENGTFPGTGGTSYCLSPSDTTVVPLIANEFKGGNVPVMPNSSQTVTIDGVTCAGAFVYSPVAANGVGKNAAAIFYQTESVSNATHLASGYDSATEITSSTQAEDIEAAAATQSALISAYNTDPTNVITVYTTN